MVVLGVVGAMFGVRVGFCVVVLVVVVIVMGGVCECVWGLLLCGGFVFVSGLCFGVGGDLVVFVVGGIVVVLVCVFW